MATLCLGALHSFTSLSALQLLEFVPVPPTELVPSERAVVLLSCVLSALGSGLLMATHALWPDLRSQARRKGYIIDPKRLHCSPGSSILQGRQISSSGTLVSPFTEILRRCSKLRRDTSGSQLALRPGQPPALPRNSKGRLGFPGPTQDKKLKKKPVALGALLHGGEAIPSHCSLGRLTASLGFTIDSLPHSP